MTPEEPFSEELPEIPANPPAEQSGVGMVGSITFALMGEATADLPPEHIYAMHCGWELEWTNDPRAPAERTIEFGLKMLREFNQI